MLLLRPHPIDLSEDVDSNKKIKVPLELTKIRWVWGTDASSLGEIRWERPSPARVLATQVVAVAMIFSGAVDRHSGNRDVAVVGALRRARQEEVVCDFRNTGAAAQSVLETQF